MECSDSAKVIISMNFDRDIRPRMAGLMSSPENNRLNKLLLEFFLSRMYHNYAYIKFILFPNTTASAIH